MYSSRTRVHIFKDSDSDSSPFVRTRTRTLMTRTRTRAIRRTQTRTQMAHWDSMFKKIQWTFIYFLNSNYLVSYVQYQCMAGYCGTVSSSAKAIQYTCHKLTLNSMTVPATASWTRVQQWENVHVATQDRTLEQVSYDLNAMWTCCNILACNDDQISTCGLYSWSPLVEIL